MTDKVGRPGNGRDRMTSEHSDLLQQGAEAHRLWWVDYEGEEPDQKAIAAAVQAPVLARLAKVEDDFRRYRETATESLEATNRWGVSAHERAAQVEAELARMKVVTFTPKELLRRAELAEAALSTQREELERDIRSWTVAHDAMKAFAEKVEVEKEAYGSQNYVLAAQVTRLEGENSRLQDRINRALVVLTGGGLR
jgi:Fe2+ transport system protein B